MNSLFKLSIVSCVTAETSKISSLQIEDNLLITDANNVDAKITLH